MRRPTVTLRNTLAVTTAVITSLALAASLAMVVFTTNMQRAGAELAASVESVRLAEEAQIDLLLHARVTDPIVQRNLERDLQRRLDEARLYTPLQAERMDLERAQAEVDAYVAAARSGEASGEQQRAAYDALEALVDVNLQTSRVARDSAQRWGRTAEIIAFAAAALVVLIASALVWWLRRRAFQPVLALAQVMDRYGRGHRDVRAEARGPEELRDMAERFNAMAEALAEQRAAQMAFLGGVAHDLRNPLSALATSVGTIAPDRPLPPEALVRRTVEMVKRQVTRLDRMLNDFLDTARIEAGQLDLQPQEHDLRVLVSEVVELFEATMPARQLQVSLPEGPVNVHCDRLRLEQVISNLVSNAIKYSPGGTRVEVVVSHEQDQALVAVTDHGIGICDEDRPRLFQPFQRVGLSKENIPGVGLGLFVVRRIVESHGGRIEVESTHGQGSRFSVWLPLVTEPAPLHHFH